MKNKNAFGMTLEIDGKFGSEFQCKNAQEALKLVLLSWVQFYSARHKKNKIDIYDGGGNAYIIDKTSPLARR